MLRPSRLGGASRLPKLALLAFIVGLTVAGTPWSFAPLVGFQAADKQLRADRESQETIGKLRSQHGCRNAGQVSVGATAACSVLLGVALAAVSVRRASAVSSGLLSFHGQAVRTVTRHAESADTVTGTKFEEEDETKNPSRRPGHAVKGMPEVDPETAAKQARIREHQDKCTRLSWSEEIRTLMAQKDGFATISTVSCNPSIEGYPTGSIVAFATDEKGRPIFVFSAMSTHTKNLLKDARASLCVTEVDFRGAADARVVLTGKVTAAPKDEQEGLKQLYMEKHAGAYWASFGDFQAYRMDDILDLAFVGGFARAGGITPQEYYDASVDPCLAFSGPVMTHMNNDHEASIKSYIQYLVGAGEVEGAQMKRLDRYGFDVRVTQGGGTGVLRVPFPEPVTERKDIKTAIMGLSKQVAALQEEAAE